MRQELWCKPGGHFWTREATRGRKPIACEEHRVATTPAPEPEVDCQYCVIQDDTLYGKGEDGRRIQLVNGPDFNPGDQGMAEKKEDRWYFVLFEAAPPQGVPPVPSPNPDVQTLTCKHGGGHLWTRPAQRGRKPEFCPEHRPQPESTREPTESQYQYMARRRQEETERREELARATQQAAAQSEFATIDQRIEHADDGYWSALRSAIRVNVVGEIDRAFNLADIKQVALINLLERKRHLAKVLGKSSFKP